MYFYEYIQREQLLEMIIERSKKVGNEMLDIRYKGIRHAIAEVGGNGYKDALVFPGYLDRGDKMPLPFLFIAMEEQGVIVLKATIGLFRGGQDDVKDINKLNPIEAEYLLEMMRDDEYYFPI